MCNLVDSFSFDTHILIVNNEGVRAVGYVPGFDGKTNLRIILI